MAGYAEQAGAKANMGELEYMDPLSSEFVDKLEHIRGAVAHHIYEEESDRFLDLRTLPPSDQAHITARYMEEFDRYVDLNDGIAPEAGTSGRNAIMSDDQLQVVPDRH